MKRYKLKKDLPTFKAGDIFELRDDGCLWLAKHTDGEKHWKDDVMAYHEKTLERFPNILTDWFEEAEGGTWKPKEDEKYWYIGSYGDTYFDIWSYDGLDKGRLAIGNCFKFRTDAEEAVEKLKALKRLRDKGFRFIAWNKYTNYRGIVQFTCVDGTAYINDYSDDLDILFGGGE